MKNRIETDVVLVGAGIMSATLGTMLQELDPGITMVMLERLSGVARESSDAMNNAGTGHAAYCELNYTPQKSDGSVEISKAAAINASFEVTLEFWSYLVKKGALPEARKFLNPTPHVSFVWGDENVRFLKARYTAMKQHHLFEQMEYTEDPSILENWIPLVMKNRVDTHKLAATYVDNGTDCDFGAVTRFLSENLQKSANFSLSLQSEVRSLQQQSDGRWLVKVWNAGLSTFQSYLTKFVFIGAGGGALPLLAQSGIAESKGYGGFPVTGQWLVCTNPDVIAQHGAKVYGKASVGTPPMSVPHLDTRVINGKKALLFGPYAGFSTKFLKQGSYLDLPFSLNIGNLFPMLEAGLDNLPLTKYLIGEVLQSQETRLHSLRQYFPDAQGKDWELAIAGQRVQIIKKDATSRRGKLEFGTEVIMAKDGSISALLGASPGASTAVATMLKLIEHCFAERIKSGWAQKLKEILPSYGESLEKDATLLRQVRAYTAKTLQMDS